MFSTKKITRVIVVAIISFGLTGLISLIIGSSPLYNKYKVWNASARAQLALVEADINKKILLHHAQGKNEEAKWLAKAEIERAKGIAKATSIVGQSLNNNDAYLRYLWIQSMLNNNNQIIYIPTEANLPIMETTRESKKEYEEKVKNMIENII